MIPGFENARSTRSRRFPVWLLAAVISIAAAGSSCTHAHMSPNYGQSYSAWFAAQHVRQEPADSAATKRALGNLDAQEAAAISKSFRRTTGAADANANGQGQMVMMGTNRAPAEAYLPPPSVPTN
jgi:hypothetical protein